MGIKGTLGLLRDRDLAALSAGQLVSDLGDWACYIALVILVYNLTGSGAALAGITTLRVLPSIVLAPFAGVLVDRCDRRHIMIVSDVLRGFAVLELAAADSLPAVYGVAVATAVLSTLFTPARSALLPNIVGRERLLPANALLDSLSYMMLLIGPGVGGAVVAVAGLHFAFQLNAASFFFSALCVAAVRPPARSLATQGSRSILGDLWQGAAFALRHRTIFALMVVGTVAMLGMGAFNILLLMLVAGGTGIGRGDYALLLSAMGLGTLVGALFAPRVAEVIGQETAVGAGIVLMGLSTAAVAAVPQMQLLLVLLTSWGFAGAVASAMQGTMLGLLLPDGLRARGFSTYTTLTGLAAMLSTGLAGYMLNHFQVQPLIAAASVPILAAALFSFAALRPPHS